MTTTNVGLASTSTEVTPSLERKDSQEEYGTLLQRWHTFTNWPYSSIVSPEQLANAGFYYLQCNDKVRCAFCGHVFGNWKSDDDPHARHRNVVPECDFYMRKLENDTFYLKNVKLIPGTTSSLEDLGIHAHRRSTFPDLATYKGRLQTFSGWPENLKQTPELVASAGFYYVGIEDRVTCFHCGGVLGEWEPTDEAWTVHATSFPRCEFVNLVRGQKFIKHCIDTRPPLNPSILEGVAEDKSPDVAGAYANSDQLVEDVLHEKVMEDDASRDHINNPTEQYKDDEVHNTQQTTTKNENEITLNKEEKSKLSNGKSNASKRKTSILLEETAFLKEENRILKEARLCKTCMDKEVAVVFLPCGHTATCIDCALPVSYCLLCREEIRATARIFLS